MGDLTLFKHRKINNHYFPIHTFSDVKTFIKLQGNGLDKFYDGFAFKNDFSNVDPFVAVYLDNGIKFEILGKNNNSMYVSKFILRNLTRLRDSGSAEGPLTVVCKLGKHKLDKTYKLFVYYVVNEDVILFGEDEIFSLIDKNVWGVVPVRGFGDSSTSENDLVIPFKSNAVDFLYTTPVSMTLLGARPKQQQIRKDVA
jgi:hypothetical protein